MCLFYFGWLLLLVLFSFSFCRINGTQKLTVKATLAGNRVEAMCFFLAFLSVLAVSRRYSWRERVEFNFFLLPLHFLLERYMA
jgi:hypothetical protein